MKIECIIDGKALSLSLSSDKPLSLILAENLNNSSINASCHGGNCGNCIVLMNGRAALSCLVPAFRIRGSSIITFESFSKSRDFRDIEKAYQSTGFRPCPNCIASRTMLIENILRRYENNDLDPEVEEILQENSIIKCHCLDQNSLIGIVRESLSYRRKRNVRRA